MIRSEEDVQKFLYRFDIQADQIIRMQAAWVVTTGSSLQIVKNIPKHLSPFLRSLNKISSVPNFQHHDGVILQDFVPHHRTKATREDARQAARALAQYHGVSDFPDNSGRLAHLERHRRVIAKQSDEFSQMLVNELHPVLVAYEPRQYSFVHGDPWPQNFVLSGEVKIIDYDRSHPNLNGFDLSYVECCWPHFFQDILDEYQKYRDISEFMSDEGNWYSKACFRFCKYAMDRNKEKLMVNNRKVLKQLMEMQC